MQKLHKTSKCLWPIYEYVCFEMNLSFRHFHKWEYQSHREILTFTPFCLGLSQKKITCRKSSGLLWQNPLPHFYSIRPPLKIEKVQVPPFWQHWKIFRYPCRKWSEDTRVHRSVLRKITIDLFYFWNVYDVSLLE